MGEGSKKKRKKRFLVYPTFCRTSDIPVLSSIPETGSRRKHHEYWL